MNKAITQDVIQALKDAENSLRDLIAVVLQAKLGTAWIENCGVSSERLEKWKERKIAEEKRRESGAVEQRLIHLESHFNILLCQKTCPGRTVILSL